jgi:nucleoside-diphosphate-sugar epimerase
LVTGAAGFIGSALCSFLSRAGAEVWGAGRRPRGPTARWLSCDVTDRAQVEAALQAARPEVVFHLASVVSGARKLDVVLPTLHGNLVSFVNVALAAAEMKCARIVCMGSLQEPDQALPAIPSSPYAAAKYAASCYARMLANVFDVPVVIARPLMVYGPGQSDLTKLVPQVLSRLLAGGRAPLSTGVQPFDWVYIDDVCEALLAIGSSDRVIGRTIDVGTGVLTPVIDVARGIARRLNAVDRLDVGAIPDRIGEPTRAADTETTRSLTGWRARFGLEEGLDLSVEWFKAGAVAEATRRGNH